MARYLKATRREAVADTAGARLAAFEDEFASYLGVAHAVACNSGTDALLLAADVVRETAGKGEIITSPFTFAATAEAILYVGARPVFADISEPSWNLDPDALRAAIGPATRAVIPVHIFGQSADMDAIGSVAKTSSPAPPR